MSYYHYHPATFEYLGTTPKRIDNTATIANGTTTYLPPPNYATLVVVPNTTTNQAAIYDTVSDSWSIVEDYRGVAVYDIEGNESVIETIGPLPEGLYLNMSDITDQEKKDHLLNKIIEHSDTLKQSYIAYQGINIQINDSDLSDFRMDLEWLNADKYNREITGSVTEISYTYNSTESSFTITGSPSENVTVDDVVVLTDGTVFSVTRVDGTTYYSADDDRPNTTGTFSVDSVYVANFLTYIVLAETGYTEHKFFIEVANDIYTSILDYKRQIKNSISNKLNELDTLTGAQLDNYDVTTGWPSRIYT